jgi:hypothetical protein
VSFLNYRFNAFSSISLACEHHATHTVDLSPSTTLKHQPQPKADATCFKTTSMR